MKTMTKDEITYSLYEKTCPECGGKGHIQEKKYIYTHEGATATLYSPAHTCEWCDGTGINKNDHE